MDQRIGRKLDGRYELQELIGSGGMARVYKAQDLVNNRIVAVKILKEEFLDNEEVMQRFRNESRAISMLDHPNIVHVYDVSVWDKIPFIVMELVDGVDLKQYMDMNGGRLSWKDTVRFTEETLNALQHAHEHGIIHRDVKPQNIMLLRDGSIKVMDFGIARFSRGPVRTTADTAMGSVHYISPEQAKGDITDAKSDIYSVGVMMYEMLTGCLPFAGDNTMEVAIRQISEPPVPPRQKEPSIPEGLEAVVLKAMEKDPGARYASAADMLQALAVFKSDPSIQFEYQYLTNSQVRYTEKVTQAKKAAPEPKTKATVKKKGMSHIALPVLAGMAVAFALGAAVLVYLIFHYSGNTLLEKRADVQLPNFVGMNVNDILNNSQYTSQFTFTVKKTYRADYEADQVYDQSPKGNKTVKEGHEVILRVSEGVQVVTVPDVTGYTKDEAVQALNSLGLSVLVRYQVDGSIPIGQVIKTDPQANTQLSSGQSITVFVSSEKVDNEREVPELRGLTSLDDAKKLLSDNSLSLGTATGVENDQPAGTILEQSVEPGTKVYTGTTINVSYSLGYTTKTWTVTVNLTAENGGTIKNGQVFTYPDGEYTTTGGGLIQSFNFKITTTEGSVTLKLLDKEYVINGDTTLSITVKKAVRPDGCTCPAGDDHFSDNKECILNQHSSSSSSSSSSSTADSSSSSQGSDSDQS